MSVHIVAGDQHHVVAEFVVGHGFEHGLGLLITAHVEAQQGDK